MKLRCLRYFLTPALIATVCFGHLVTAQTVSVAKDNLQILVTDSSSAVLQADANDGQLSLVAAGQKLVRPFGIACGPNGVVYVSDTGTASIVAIDPTTGNQAVVASRGVLGLPFGIAVDRDGSLLVANATALIRVNPQTGGQTVASANGYFGAPLGVTVRANGDIVVVDQARKIIQVDRRTGSQQLISQAGFLKSPQAIASKGDNIYVTDVGTPDGNFGIGRVLQIDARSGNQTIIAEGNFLVCPVGIAIDDNGQLFVGDPYTINPESSNLFDGGIIQIDPNTGTQMLIARGSGDYVNPRGIALVSFHSNNSQLSAK